MKHKLTKEEAIELFKWIEGDYAPEWLHMWAIEQYGGEIPYGTMKGRTGDMDEWLSDHIEWVTDHFHDDLQLLANEKEIK